MQPADWRRHLRAALGVYDCDLLSDGDTILMFCTLCHSSTVFPQVGTAPRRILDAAAAHAFGCRLSGSTKS